jgi:hypothetical protein
LWVVWIALGLKVGVDPVSWAYAGSIASFAVTLFAIWRTARLLVGEELPALLAVVMFGANYSVSSYATGGLETMPQTALLALAGWKSVQLLRSERTSTRSVVAISLLLTAAVLTRLDSVVIGFWFGLAVLWAAYSRRSGWSVIAALVAPLLVILGTWFIWKLNYYGEILPNTFAAKVGGDGSGNNNGLLFLERFFHWYLIWPLAFAGGVGVLIGMRTASSDGERARPRRVWLLALPMLSWFAYIVFVGGDFMEFRFLVPVAPLVFILLAYLIHEGIGKATGYPLACAAAALVILGGASYRHATEFKGVSEDKTLDSIAALSTFYGNAPDGRWDRIGLRLRDDLAGSDAVLAIHAVGAIPYYSGLRTVDMWGLNDPWIARHGKEAPPEYPRPGHRRHATLAYLKERRVNFVIGEPTRLRRGELTRMAQPRVFSFWIQTVINFNEDPIRDATLVAMPIDKNEVLLMWYLTPSPAIDRLIAKHGWEVQRFGRRPQG